VLLGNEAVGGISGWTYDTQISDCHSHFSQSSTLYGLGGIAGYCFAGSEISDCSFSGSLYCGGSGCGGIAGQASYTTIERCQATGGSMLTSGDAGGIVGDAEVSVQIMNCHSNIQIRGLHTAGGLAGWVGGYSSIESCSSTGDVEGYYYLGGLVGALNNSSAIDCYATGNVDAYNHVGGFVGTMSQSGIYVRNCYSTGAVTSTEPSTTGGFAGVGNPAQVIHSYWDTQSSGYATSPAGEGRTTAQMIWPYDADTYTGWDFETVWAHDTGNVNGGYPILRNCTTPANDPIAQVPPAADLSAGPNPFKDVLRIRLCDVNRKNARLSVYDIKGRKIRSIAVPGGSSQLIWDGRDEDQRPCPNGIYILRLSAGKDLAGAIRVTLLR
jgi:hypothetical protein